MKKPKSKKIRRAGGGVKSPRAEGHGAGRCRVQGCQNRGTHATPLRVASPFEPEVLRSIEELERSEPGIGGDDLFIRVAMEGWRKERGFPELADGESWPVSLDDLITLSVFTDSLLSYLASIAIDGDPRGVLAQDTAAWALGRLGVDPAEVDSWGAGDERVRDLADRVWLSIPAVKRALGTRWAAPAEGPQ